MHDAVAPAVVPNLYMATTYGLVVIVAVPTLVAIHVVPTDPVATLPGFRTTKDPVDPYGLVPACPVWTKGE